jgi:DHA1 family bicyclomycin/chloramphenicol resistance-like MFS transporter
MQPIGHIAGVGAATYSFISILVAVTIAIFVGQFIETTVMPMFIGFFIAGVISFILIRIVKIREKVNVPK